MTLQSMNASAASSTISVGVIWGWGDCVALGVNFGSGGLCGSVQEQLKITNLMYVSGVQDSCVHSARRLWV